MSSSFSLEVASYVRGIEIQAIGPCRDKSWTIHVTRTNFTEASKLGSAITTINLVPEDCLDHKKQSRNRTVIAVPGACSKIIASVGIGVVTTDKRRDFLAIEIRSDDAGGGNSHFEDSFRIGDLP